MALKRVNLNLEERLVAKVDDYAAEVGLNRTGAISAILGNFFRENQALSMMSDLLNKLNEDELKKAFECSSGEDGSH